jgi:hypothetical protein
VVMVNGEDVTGTILSPVVPVLVSGRISFDDGGTARAVNPASVRVVMQRLDPSYSGMQPSVQAGSSVVHGDVTFEFKTAPGRIALRAASGRWRTRAVYVDGADVTDTGVDVNTQGVRGVRIELTSQQQQVSGTVTDARGDVVEDCAVVMFARDRTRWIAPFDRYLAIERTGKDGRFGVETLPPGDYYAIATDQIDGNEWQAPESLDALSRYASVFSLRSGEVRTLDLKLLTPLK